MKSFLSSLRKIDDSLSVLSHLKIKNFVVSVLLCGGSIGALQLITTRPSQAEGSKEMTSDVSGYRPWFNSPVGGTLISGVRQQLVANVYAEAGEIINVGSSGIAINGATIILKSPNGTTYTATGSGGLGIITNRAQEVAGPLPNSGGYTPYSQTVLATEAGVWQVTFISPGANSIAALPNTTAWTRSGNQGTGTNGALVAWDVTVRNSGGTSIPGRAYLTNLGADMGTYYPSILKTNFYVLTKDGYVYQVNTNTLAPLVFNFFSNNKGFTSAGNPTYKSLNSVPSVGTNVFDPNATDSGTNITNKMFLNNPLFASLPTSASHPVAGSTWLIDTPINPSISSFTYTRNVSVSGGTFNFTANTAGSYSIEIDTNNNGSYTDTVDRNIQGLTLAGGNSYVWDGKDGAGKIVNNTNTLNARVATRSGEVHFPVADAESNPNGFIITRLNGIGAGDSTIYWDDTSISTTIGTKNLTGAISSPSGAHTWGSTNAAQANEFGNNVGIDTWTFIRSAFVFTSVLPAPNLGTCPATTYLSQGINNTSIKLNSLDLPSGVLTPISASNFAAGVNAIGFNQLDGYIYGMKAGSNNTVMKIDADGVGYDLGAITGLPLADYIAGDVDANGILYVKSLVGTSAYGIDVNYASSTYLTIVKTITGLATISGAVTGVQDFAFHPTNGKLYTIQGSTGKVFEISWPAAGSSVAATVIDRGKPTNLPIGIYGGVYFASDGSLYGYSNGTAGSNNGAIYRMTNVVGTGLPVATPLTTTATGISSNDGARCPLAPPVLPPGTTISGTVFNDTDSSKIQNGTEAGTNGGGLNAVLLDSSNAVVATTTVVANGTYSFSNVSPATYTVLITNGTTATITLPTNWVSTGENLDGITDTTIDSTLVNVVVSTTNVIANFGIKQSVASKPNLLLVKRITAINNNIANGNISLNSYDPETDTTNLAYPYDKNVIQSSITPPNSDKWPYTVGIPSLSSTFLLGSRNGGTIKPNDTVEYTIYFLSAGDSAAKKVLFCDRVPANVTFIPNSFNSVTADPLGLSGVDRGIAIRLGNNLTSYTNINDGDIARYYPPLSEPITDFPTINCGGSNTNGAVVVNLSDRPNATGIAVDDAAAGAFGFVRFRGEVK
jgi:uncharacterized repeat protein (TIGR01451 family)